MGVGRRPGRQVLPHHLGRVAPGLAWHHREAGEHPVDDPGQTVDITIVVGDMVLDHHGIDIGRQAGDRRMNHTPHRRTHESEHQRPTGVHRQHLHPVDRRR